MNLVSNNHGLKKNFRCLGLPPSIIIKGKFNVLMRFLCLVVLSASLLTLNHGELNFVCGLATIALALRPLWVSGTR